MVFNPNHRLTTGLSGEIVQMSDSESGKSPLTRLILVIVCLSLAGSFVAGVHYFALDLPQQNALPAPVNGQICFDKMSCLPADDPGILDRCMDSWCPNHWDPDAQEACWAECELLFG
jgi:hypothetical protein